MAKDQSPGPTTTMASRFSKFKTSSRKIVAKLWARYQALPRRKKILYTTIFVLVHVFGIALAIVGQKLENNLSPLAAKMSATPYAWLILSALIAIVSIPPLFGHEILAVVAGYVYGALYGFLILTISSIVGESFVYFGFRYCFRGALDRFRKKHANNYGVFVAVVEDGGVLMLWFIRMSVIPPHFSTPLFSSLRTITWWKWMAANILASPVKFFPPVFIGTLLRNKNNNSPVGDLVFALSSIITVGVLWYIWKAFKAKKKEEKERLKRESDSIEAEEASKQGSKVDTTEVPPEEGVEMSSMDRRTNGNEGANGWPLYTLPASPKRAHFVEPETWV